VVNVDVRSFGEIRIGDRIELLPGLSCSSFPNDVSPTGKRGAVVRLIDDQTRRSFGLDDAERAIVQLDDEPDRLYNISIKYLRVINLIDEIGTL